MNELSGRLGLGSISPRKAGAVLGTSHSALRGGILLWLGTVAFSGSSVGLFALLARRLDHTELAAASSVVLLAFVFAVMPGALQLQAAAVTTDGAGTPKVPWLKIGALGATGAALSPVVAMPLHVPTPALALVATQLLPSSAVAVRRGGLLGQRLFGVLGRSLLVEGMVRLVVGTLLAMAGGPTGLATALVLAPAVALVLTPGPASATGERTRPVTPLSDTALALGLVALFVNLDVIMAPAALGQRLAVHYDLSAVPAKGVFVALLAVGWILFPAARLSDSGRPLMPHIMAAVSAGAVLGICLAIGHPWIAAVLGRADPSPALLAPLGLAMALGGGSAMAANIAVARGLGRPWAPVAVGAVLFAALTTMASREDTFALSVLLAQAVAFGMLCTVVARR